MIKCKHTQTEPLQKSDTMRWPTQKECKEPHASLQESANLHANVKFTTLHAFSRSSLLEQGWYSFQGNTQLM